MGKVKKDTALKDFWRNNERFADLFNGIFFHGEQVLRAEDMEEQDTDLSAVIRSKERIESLEQYRDVVKCANGMNYMILAIENQDKIHYAMPLRCRLYDDLQYLKQVKEIAKDYDEKGDWSDFTEEEFLSRMKKEDKIIPCLTIVIYYGEQEWNGPRYLSDMMNIPKPLQPYFQDYQMYLLCVRDEDGSRFTQKDVKDLFYVLNCLYHGREQKIREQNVYVNSETYQAIAAVENNRKKLSNIVTKKKEEVSMCSALDRIWEDGRKEGIKEGSISGELKKEQNTIKQLLRQNILTLEQIAQVMEVDLERVQKVRTQLETA